MNRIYACIDLKSFYASVECRERGLDPLTTNLVVADSKRTEKTICLAVSPSLKKLKIPGRARLFEVVQKVREANYQRKKDYNIYHFTSKSYDINELNKNKYSEIDFIIAKPRMSYYIKYSTDIYNVYLKYLSKEDIYVYSIDEIFCDITNYLSYSKLTPKELITKIIHDVYETTGITATAGIGTNPYLAKVAMDIVAKKAQPDKYGVRIAYLDEMGYRKFLWSYKPLTSFWRVGVGYAKKLEENGLYTMGDIARCSLKNEELLYKLFGVNAEILIDHAWGVEPCTIKDIKSYKPQRNSISTGQVLHCPYDYQKTKLIVKEMADSIALDLVSKNLLTDQLILVIDYDGKNITEFYQGEIKKDYYGRIVPKHANGTINLTHKTSSSKYITTEIIKLYDKIINKNLLTRRITIVANNLTNINELENNHKIEQFDLFTDYKKLEEEREKIKEAEQEEKKLQQTLLDIKNKYGKNAILRGMNFEEGSTAIERNSQIGGHHE